MMVTFITEATPCICGWIPRGVEVARVRVNKCSLATVGLSVGGMPWRCRECGWPLSHETRVRRWLDPADAAMVTAARARRWPEATR